MRWLVLLGLGLLLLSSSAVQAAVKLSLDFGQDEVSAVSGQVLTLNVYFNQVDNSYRAEQIGMHFDYDPAVFEYVGWAKAGGFPAGWTHCTWPITSGCKVCTDTPPGELSIIGIGNCTKKVSAGVRHMVSVQFLVKTSAGSGTSTISMANVESSVLTSGASSCSPATAWGGEGCAGMSLCGDPSRSECSGTDDQFARGRIDVDVTGIYVPAGEGLPSCPSYGYQALTFAYRAMTVMDTLLVQKGQSATIPIGHMMKYDTNHYYGWYEMEAAVKHEGSAVTFTGWSQGSGVPEYHTTYGNDYGGGDKILYVIDASQPPLQGYLYPDCDKLREMWKVTYRADGNVGQVSRIFFDPQWYSNGMNYIYLFDAETLLIDGFEHYEDTDSGNTHDTVPCSPLPAMGCHFWLNEIYVKVTAADSATKPRTPEELEKASATRETWSRVKALYR